ncbi:SPOR domain-containing protein [Herminiimonas sp.]|uniref:SPOR domain-containing protein n=1 Tax=Herminiimonas sp. TaxID=1926289 RepID=UPI002722526D|nr:SPOR domain-containing protein [Herminiimonas sp.]MDO8306152.1 SPOR domain-containing protein [Herminiimonas sp.]
MGLFSFLRKNKQESSVGNSDFYSQADEEKPNARSNRKQGNKREAAVDPVLPEKKRARRRLVGAIALVLAAVIGLPMILDSEPKPLGDDINIQIPSKETSAPAGKSAVVQKASQSTVAASLNPEEEVLEPVTPKAETKIETKAEVKATEPEKKSQSPVVKADSPEAKAAAAKAALAAPATAKPEHAGDAVRAKAILEGKANPAAAPKVSGKLVLQVAALASQDKVNELQKKLQGAGLKSYTQKVATESGERIRVRIGPFANAAEAEKARAKLDKIGLTAKLIPA